MSYAATAETHHHPRMGQGRLWFGLCAAVVAWGAQGLSSFFISWQACQDGDADWGILSGQEVRWLLYGITAAALTIALVATLLSFLNWRRLEGDRSIAESKASEREAFMALGGVAIGIVFLGGIIWFGLGPIMVGVCETAK